MQAVTRHLLWALSDQGKISMIADDEEFCLEAMRLYLTKVEVNVQYGVDLSINGQVAVESFISNHKIFTDFSMPIIDGIESTKKIRKFLRDHGSKNKHPIIVGVTGHATEEYR